MGQGRRAQGLSSRGYVEEDPPQAQCLLEVSGSKLRLKRISTPSHCLSNKETFLTLPVKSPGPSPHYCQAQN